MDLNEFAIKIDALKNELLFGEEQVYPPFTEQYMLLVVDALNTAYHTARLGALFQARELARNF